jgi:hypothetical protein
MSLHQAGINAQPLCVGMSLWLLFGEGVLSLMFNVVLLTCGGAGARLEQLPLGLEVSAKCFRAREGVFLQHICSVLATYSISKSQRELPDVC